MKTQKIIILLVIIFLSLHCESSYAIQITPYFRIAEEYNSNPEKTLIYWTGREICIEGKISNTGENAKGGKFIMLSEESPEPPIEFVVYGFHFTEIPKELEQLHEGQKVRLRGRIISINMRDDPRCITLIIQAEPSRILKVYPYTDPEEKDKAEWFFAIPAMYEMDSEQTKRIWLGKEIILEEEIGAVMTVDKEGNKSPEGDTLIMFAKKSAFLSVQNVGYLFFFDGRPEDAEKLSAGQKVKIKGRVESISLRDGIYYIIASSSMLIK